jgi:hypothetical protein
LPGQLPIPGTQQPNPPGAGQFQAGDAPAGSTAFQPTTLLVNPLVQQQLGLADDQVNQLRQANAQLQEQFRPKIAQLGNLNDPKARDRGFEITNAMNDDFMRTAGSILTPEQMTRLQQLQLQQMGPVTAFSIPAVQQSLGFNPQQISRFQELREDFSERLTRLYPELASGDPRALAKLNAFRADFDRRWQGVLTPEQQQAWSGMLGEPFVFAPEASNEVRFDD